MFIYFIERDEQLTVSKLIAEDDIQEVSNILSKPTSCFVCHDLLLSSSRNKKVSQGMLNVLFENGLDIQQCDYSVIMMYRTWIVEYLFKHQLKVKIDINSSENTHGMPIWHLLMDTSTLSIMHLIPLKNITAPMNILAKNRNGDVYDDKHQYGVPPVKSNKYCISDDALKVYYKRSDEVYDRKIHKYMQAQILNERIDALEKKLSKN